MADALPPTTNGYTLHNYRRLLRAVHDRGLTFMPFDREAPKVPALFLRHDIDYSMVFAERFARIDMEENAQATFFLQLRSRLYNLFDPDVAATIRRILDMGHFIGFHAVVPQQWHNLDALRKEISRDFALFRQAIPEAMPVFAWHNPNMLVSQGFNFIAEDLPGLINAYGSFAGGKPPYFADSNMRYDSNKLISLINNAPDAFQLALAPMQWCPETKTMPEVMISNLVQKIREIEKGFQENDVYSTSYPLGLPESILTRFSKLALGAILREDE